MAEDTTDTTNSQQATDQATDAAANGGGDATQSTQGDVQDAGGDDATVLGGATEAGSGDSSEDGDKGADAGSDDTAAADGPPETYELKPITVGEGDAATEIEIDKGLLETATPILKDLGLTNEQAQKVAGLVPEVHNRILQQQADNFAATKADWAKEAKADKEIGGAKWTETQSLAAKALDQFGAPSVKDADGKETNPFRVLLNESGIGNHPELIRMFRNIGEKIGEDTDLVRGDGAVNVKKPREEILYPNDVPK